VVKRTVIYNNDGLPIATETIDGNKRSYKPYSITIELPDGRRKWGRFVKGELPEGAKVIGGELLPRKGKAIE